MPGRKKKTKGTVKPKQSLDDLIEEGRRLREAGDRTRRSMRVLAADIEAARVESELARARAAHSRTDPDVFPPLR